MKPCRRHTFKSVFFFVAILPICGCTLEAIEKTGDPCPDYAFLIHNDDSGNTSVVCADDEELSESSRQTCPVDAQYCLTDEADRNFCAINVTLGNTEAKRFPCRSSEDTCDCPDHQICVNNQCFDNPDTKCNCKKDETCDANGKCIPSVKKCSGDEDCPEGLVCIDDICSEPATGCSGDEDCPEGLVCIDDTCVEHAIDCSGDEDCPEGLVCIDDICAKPIIECSGDEYCPEGLVCIDDICSEPITGCSGDGDCPEGQICIDGICDIPVSYECSIDDDCAGGETCSGGFCVDSDPPVECVADGDCSEGWVCQSNVCIDTTPKPECSESKPCSGELICKDSTCQPCPATTHYLSGACVQCTSHDHCSANAYCNANACVDCGSKKVNAAKTACVDCLDHSDCSANAYCNANACVDCGSKKVNTAKTACVECNSNADCKAGEGCQADKCVPLVPTCDKTSEVLCNNNECRTSGAKIIITVGQSSTKDVKEAPSQSANTLKRFIRYDTPDIFGITKGSDGSTWYVVLVNGKKGYVSKDDNTTKELPVKAKPGVRISVYNTYDSNKKELGTINNNYKLTLHYCHDEVVNEKKWCYVERNSLKGYAMARKIGESHDIISIIDEQIPSTYVPQECN